MSVTVKSDFSKLEKEFDRLLGLPDLSMKNSLDNVLEIGFKATQANVHVITGSLKSSGKQRSEADGDTWIGEIEYGGPSLGINNPVDYAIYEKARDEDHDFFATLPALHVLYVSAIKKGLSK